MDTTGENRIVEKDFKIIQMTISDFQQVQNSQKNIFEMTKMWKGCFFPTVRAVFSILWNTAEDSTLITWHIDPNFTGLWPNKPYFKFFFKFYAYMPLAYMPLSYMPNFFCGRKICILKFGLIILSLYVLGSYHNRRRSVLDYAMRSSANVLHSIYSNFNKQ